jgi:hypothetical protein
MPQHRAEYHLEEDDVIRVSQELEDAGFEYDVDFTTLYGEGWKILGIISHNPKVDALLES